MSKRLKDKKEIRRLWIWQTHLIRLWKMPWDCWTAFDCLWVCICTICTLQFVSQFTSESPGKIINFLKIILTNRRDYIGMGIERSQGRRADGLTSNVRIAIAALFTVIAVLFFLLGYKITFCVLCLREFLCYTSTGAYVVYMCVCVYVCLYRTKAKIHSGNVKIKSFFFLKKKKYIACSSPLLPLPLPYSTSSLPLLSHNKVGHKEKKIKRKTV